MARVFVLNGTSLNEDPDPDQPTLWFQWCRYLYDDGKQEYGYRFIWRRASDDGGGLQAARGQARIPSLAEIERLLTKAREENWGHFNGDDFPNEFVVLWASVDDVLDPKLDRGQRLVSIQAFVEGAKFSGLSLYDFERMIGSVPVGGAYGKGDLFRSAQELFQGLDEREREQLIGHYLQTVQKVGREFPQLVSEFPDQFKE
jgi:hypothetical protein